MRRASTSGGTRRGSVTSPKRVAFDDSGGPRKSALFPSPKQHGTQGNNESKQGEEKEVEDVATMEMSLAFECRDTVLSMLSSEIGKLKKFHASYLIPLLEDYSQLNLLDSDVETLSDSNAGHAMLKSRIDQLKIDSQQKDQEISQAKDELSRMLERYYDCLDEQVKDREEFESSFDQGDSEVGQANINALLPHQHRPSFIVKREQGRQEIWKKWSGNLPIPPNENVGHLIVPDQRGLDFSKTNSGLQLIAIPFKPRVWLEEGAGEGRTKEKSKLEEIKYDALRRRHKSLHGADLKSLNLGDFALSFPDLARAISQLQCLRDDDIEALDEKVITQDCQENGLIVRQGQEISTVFFIGAGAVTCTTTVVSPVYGSKTCSHTLSKGDFFGNSDKAVGTYMATGHVLLFAVPRAFLQDMLLKYNEPLDQEFLPTWDEASLISHIEQFLQYLLMFTEEEKKNVAQRGGFNLPGGERLFGNKNLSRKSVVGGRANRGGSLSTRATISQFLSQNRTSLADDEIIDPEIKKSLMFDMLSSSAPEFDPTETIDNIICLTKDFFRADRVGLFRINKMKSTMSLRMSQQLDSETEVPLRGIAGYIAQTGKLLNIPDCYQNELFDSSLDKRQGYKTTQMVCVPAFVGADNLVGVLQCINTEDGLPFSKSDETLCFMIAQQMGQTLGTLLDRETGGDYAVTHRIGRDVKVRLHIDTFVYVPPDPTKAGPATAKTLPKVKEVMVMVTLVHGTSIHRVKHNSKFIPVSSDGKFKIDFTAEYELRDLPLASRLMVQIITRDTISRRPVAWCGLSLYSFERQLRTAPYCINTWDGAMPDGVLAALENNPGRTQPSFITAELSCTNSLPIFYEVPHSAKVSESRGAELHEATQLLHETLSAAGEGQMKNLAFYVEKMSPDEKKRFKRLATLHPSTAQLTEGDKDTLWRLRRYLVNMPQYLPAFLLAVDWWHLESVSETYRLLHEWEKPGRFVALQLLGAVYLDPKVRAYAVEIISSSSDDEFLEMLAPLVHQLRFEVSQNCALARLLLRRALNAPKTVGHAFFWHLQAGLRHPELTDKCKFYSNMYLRCCGDVQRTAHAHALLLLRILREIAADVAAERGGVKKRLALLRRRLREERPRLPPIFQHPCRVSRAGFEEGAKIQGNYREQGEWYSGTITRDRGAASFFDVVYDNGLRESMVKESQLQFVSSAPAFQVKGFVPQACYVIENSSGPDNVALYLVFENAVRGGRPFAVQFRCGVDTRPEMLASQLLLTMDAILRDSERQVHQCSSEFRGSANPAKAAEQEEKAGVWDLCLDDVKSGWIAQDDCVLYEVPADAVSMNYIIQTVQNVARRGGGERPPDKKLKAGEKEEVAVPVSSKLAGRNFPVDCVDNWLRICNMDPNSSHVANAPDAHSIIQDQSDATIARGTSIRLGIKGGSITRQGSSQGESTYVRVRRNAFSGPPSKRVRNADGTLRLELNGWHSVWRDTFARSFAGYYLSSLVLGLRERNAENVLVRTTGHLLNIDCAALGLGPSLGDRRSRQREPPPILPQFMRILGPVDSKHYQVFEQSLFGGFLILRRYLATLSNVVEITLGGQGIPIDAVRDAMSALSDHFFMECEDPQEAVNRFKNLVLSDKAFWTQCHGEATYPAKPMSDGWFG